MSEQEYIYIYSLLPLAEEAQTVADILGMQVEGDSATFAQATMIELSGAARVSDAEQVVVWVEQNDRAIPGEPMRTAADDYPFEVYIRAYRPWSEGAQEREARWIFDRLTDSRPDVPMLLTHEGIELLAAYLPERGIHNFPPGTDVDISDQATWANWVPETSDT